MSTPASICSLASLPEVVRTPDGAPLTGVEAARAAGQLQIQFRDGAVAAAVQTPPKGKT
jgi:hypothetical protein